MDAMGADVQPGPDVATDVMVRADMMQRVVDMRVERDIMAMADMAVAPDGGPAPDVGPLGGAPCDPRLNARACDPGFFCVHVPQQRPNAGRCQPGDGCRPGVVGDCPGIVHIAISKAAQRSVRRPAPVGGDDCVNALDIPQPCADGLVCNNSICQVPCVPGEENECPNEGRCVDISERIGVAVGYAVRETVIGLQERAVMPVRSAAMRFVATACWWGRVRRLMARVIPMARCVRICLLAAITVLRGLFV